MDTTTTNKRRAPRVVTISSSKGGAGKTTTSINVAGTLATRGLSVLLLDLDFQARLSRMLLADELTDNPDALDDMTQIGEYLLSPDYPLDEGAQPAFGTVMFVPGGRPPPPATRELTPLPGALGRLRDVLGRLRGYDAVVIDTGPVVDLEIDVPVGYLAATALVASDVIIIPTPMHQQDIDGVVDTLGLYDALVARGDMGEVDWVVLPNMVRSTVGDHKQALDTLAATYGTHLGPAVPLAEALARSGVGHARVVLKASRPAQAAYDALADRIMGQGDGPVSAPSMDDRGDARPADQNVVGVGAVAR